MKELKRILAQRHVNYLSRKLIEAKSISELKRISEALVYYQKRVSKYS